MNIGSNIALGIMAFFMFLGLITIVSSIAGLLVMWLWNWLVPDLFKGPQISWIQGWGLCMLSSLLLKSSASSSSSK